MNFCGRQDSEESGSAGRIQNNGNNTVVQDVRGVMGWEGKVGKGPELYGSEGQALGTAQDREMVMLTFHLGPIVVVHPLLRLDLLQLL